MPINCDIWKDSFGNITQLNIVPKTGMINFQVFNSETLTLGCFSKKNQIENATAEMNERYNKDT